LVSGDIGYGTPRTTRKEQMDTPGLDPHGPDDVGRLRQEEDAAAAEAARIGGRGGLESMDEAERAAAEHGGGESEGFEQAEELLEGQASHSEPAVDPLADAPAVEDEEDPSVHGEADEVERPETT
jgi:hypothetical protein